MTHKLANLKQQRGFTIVELLIVIVIIGILAAITIVAYNGIQNRAYDTSVQSDLTNLAKKMKMAIIDSPTSSYPYGNPAMYDADVRVSVNKNAYITTPNSSYNLLLCVPTTTNPTEFTIHGYSKSGKRLYVDTSGKITEYTGATGWGGGTANTICGSVNVGWVAGGAGYAASDVPPNGPWRTWAGSN